MRSIRFSSRPGIIEPGKIFVRKMDGCVFGWSVITVPRLPVGELFHTGIVVEWNAVDPGKSLVCHFGPFGDVAGVRIEPIKTAWRRTMIADGKIYFNRKLRLGDRRVKALRAIYHKKKKDRHGSVSVDLTQGRSWHLWKYNCQDFTRNLFPHRVQQRLVTQLDRDYLPYLAGCLRPPGVELPSLMLLVPKGRYVLTAWDKVFHVPGYKKPE